RYQWRMAEQEYVRVLKQQPTNAAVRAQAGEIYLGQSQDGKATEAFSAALELNPKNAGWWNLKAVSLYRQGKWQMAIDAATQAIQRDKDQASYWGNRGDSHAERGEWKLASKDFSTAIGLSPGDPSLKLKYAFCSLQLRDPTPYRNVCLQFSKNL